MYQRRSTKGLRHLLGAPIILWSLILVMAACSGDDPTDLNNDENTNEYLEEIYPFDVENDIQYGSAVDEGGQQEALLLDLYQPRDEDDDLRPAVLWLHGGGFTMGHKGEMTELARRTAQRGFVAASANYRLRENGTFDYLDPEDSVGMEVKRDAQHDIQAAVRWIRANAADLRVDPNEIYLVGYSAGGTSALRAAAMPDDPGQSGNPDQSSDVSGVVAISGHLDEGVLENAGPTLLIHGEADTKVPLEEVQEPCSSVSTCELVVIPGETHTLITSSREEVLQDVSEYLAGLVTGS